MIQWWLIYFFLIKYSLINCSDDQCNYIIEKSDNSFDRCLANQCYKFIDILSIMVEPKTCKTASLFLSFSSYKYFILFRSHLKWKLSDLFSSRSINKDRHFILFIDQLDYNDKPFDHNELIHLGINIDLYFIYIRIIHNNNYLHGLRHYHPNDPQWNIIKLKFRCLQLSAFDEYPCSSQIISPSIFHPQRPTTIIQSKTNLPSHPVLSSSTEESFTISIENKKKSTHLIVFIFIPLMITMLLFTFIYIYIIRKYCFRRDMETTSKSSTRINNSNHSINIERVTPSSSVYDNTIVPENNNHIQNPPIYHGCHLHTKTESTKNFDDNSDKVTSDNISIIREQYFVPISSSMQF